jgi:hypothetical protein
LRASLRFTRRHNSLPLALFDATSCLESRIRCIVSEGQSQILRLRLAQERTQLRFVKKSIARIRAPLRGLWGLFGMLSQGRPFGYAQGCPGLLSAAPSGSEDAGKEFHAH